MKSYKMNDLVMKYYYSATTKTKATSLITPCIFQLELDKPIFSLKAEEDLWVSRDFKNTMIASGNQLVGSNL